MLYKILHKIFGWDYIYWKNTADEGIARVHVINDGVFYWRYKNTKILDEITDIDRVVWLTCSPLKYEKYINKDRDPQFDFSTIFTEYNKINKQVAEIEKLIETNNATRI